MQCSGLKVQRISCVENTKLESKGEGNASTFSSVLLVSSSLAVTGTGLGLGKRV